MGAQGLDCEIQQRILGVCSTIRGLFAGAALQDVMTRHKIGDCLCIVKRAPGTFGTRAIANIAEELGKPASTLYEHIAVAEQWQEADLRAFLEKTNRFGQPLSWSHFVLLSRLRDSTERLSLAEACLDNDWSVRVLRYRIQQQVDDEGRVGDAALPGEPVRAALLGGIEGVGRALADLRLFDEAFATRLSDSDQAIDEELLDRALAKYAELRDRSEATIARLANARAARRHPRVAVSGSATKIEHGAAVSDEDEEDLQEELPSRTVVTGHRRRTR